jgi:hypothetical protein
MTRMLLAIACGAAATAVAAQAATGELSVRDGHRVVTVIARRRGVRSGSSADGQSVTFWSGFVLTRAPRCVPLAVWVDDEPAPRRVALPMGVRCR